MAAAQWLRRHGMVRAGLAGVVAMGGLGVAAMTVALGDCSAFGGRCPADAQPLWGSDVFGGVAAGVAVSVFAVVVAFRPGRRGAAIGAVAALLLGFFAGLWAVDVTSSFAGAG